MTSNQKVITLILVAVTAMTVVAGGFGLVASGSMHLPDDIDVDYDYDNTTNPNVNYGDVIGLNDANENATQIEENGYYVVLPESGNLDDAEYETDRGLLTEAGNDDVLLLNDTFGFTMGGNDFFGLRVDTEAYDMYDVDPRGQYEVRGLYQNTLNVPDQKPTAGDGSSPSSQLYVGTVEADQEYLVYVEDTDGNALGVSERVFESGAEVTDLSIKLGSEDTSDGNEYVVKLVRAEGLDAGDQNGSEYGVGDISDNSVIQNESVDDDGNLVTENVEGTVLIDTNADVDTSGSPDPSADETNLEIVSADWSLQSSFSDDTTVVGQEDIGVPGAENGGQLSFYDQDARVFVDHLNTDGNIEQERGVWVGQRLVIAGNIDPSPGQEFYIERDGDDGVTTVTQVQVQESDTVNEREIVIDTGYPNVEIDNLEGDFQLVTGDNTVFEWTVQEQRVDTEFNESSINLNTDIDTANLTVTGNRIGYDLIVEADGLDANQLREIVVDDEDVGVQTEDVDEGLVRITDVADEDVQENITFDFSGQDANTYDFNISVADTTAESQASIVVDFGATGDADFSKGTYEIDRGDRVSMPVNLEETDTGTFTIAEDKYDLEFGFVDSDNSGNVTIIMDTYIADEYDNDSVAVEDVFEVVGGNITGNPELPPVDGEFGAGQYTLELGVSGEEADLATLNVSARSSEEINTWVLPRNTGSETSGELTLQRLRDNGTKQDVVSYRDTLVVEVSMSGLYNSRMFDNDTNQGTLVNRTFRADKEGLDELDEEYLNTEGINQSIEELNLKIVGEAEPSRPVPHMELEDAERLRVDPQNESFYVFFKTDSTGLFNFYNEDFDVQNKDKLSDYTVHANFTEDYKFLGDDSQQNLTEEFELVEREVTVNNLESTVVNETTLNTKYSIPGSNNVTVSGRTGVAPGTQLDVRVVSEGLSPFRQVAETQVTSDGFVNSTFDFANLEPGRNMTIQFFPVDSERKEAVITQPPTAPNITNVSVNTPILVGEAASFSATVANASEGVSYNWNLGDGGTSSLPQPTYSYDTAGTYNVSLEVTKPDSGLTDTRELQVFVEERPNEPPEVTELIGPTTLDVGEAAEFGVIATDDSAQNNLQYEWNFGNDNNAAGITATNAYAAEGTYTVTVTVTDEDGAQASEDQTVQVVNPSPQDEEETDTEVQSYNLTITAEDGQTEETIPGATVTINNLSTDGVDTGGQTDDSGVYEIELNQSNYTVGVSATGYQDFSVEDVPLEQDREITASLQPEQEDGGNNTSNNSSGGNPDQPGFTLLLGALVLVSAGAFVYYRRESTGI